MELFGGRPTHDRRSRRGCKACLKRRRKCDETVPSCAACVKRGASCEYPPALRWVEPESFSGTSNHLQKSKKDEALNFDTGPAFGRTGPSLNINHPSRSSRNQFSVVTKQIPTRPSFVTSPTSLRSLGEGNCSPVIGFSGSTVSDDISETDSLDGLDGDPSRLWALDMRAMREMAAKHLHDSGECDAFMYYYETLSAIIPAFNGKNNPFRELSVPALRSPVLRSTIVSIATEHMHCAGRMPAKIAAVRHAAALKLLMKYITAHFDGTDQDEPPIESLHHNEAMLATILFQCSSNLFRGDSDIESHLECAVHFLKELGYDKQPPTSYCGTFLALRLAMIDCMAAAFRPRRPRLPLSFWLFEFKDTYDKSEPSLREIVGISQTVLAFLVHTLNLAADLAEGVDGGVVMEKGLMLELELRAHGQNLKYPSEETHGALNILSHCYYWMTYLVLQRRVLGDASSSRRVQFTISTLIDLVDRMPSKCAADCALVMPFYVAAQEAATPEMRDRFRTRSAKMMELYPYQARAHLMRFTEINWARYDEVIASSRCPHIVEKARIQVGEENHRSMF